jgi:hypothetical protein
MADIEPLTEDLTALSDPDSVVEGVQELLGGCGELPGCH